MSNSKAALFSGLNNKISKTSQQRFKPSSKVNPFILINKIQQAKPSYKSNLINKQIAYDVIIDTQQAKTEKIKNCICAARPNSQIYKRISKQFLYNFKNGVNQMLFFCGRELYPRLQTSIGLSSNPGLFMIAAIAILDEKYKEHHQRCDVEFSFLQFKEGQMYDLINYTETPLSMQQKADQHIVSFNQQFVKVFTFLQFIKLFKIALFNNKQRDFKTQSTFKSNNKQLKSTFIMKIRTKQFNIQGNLISQQQTALVDYDQGCFKSGKQKQGKNLLDYFLIEINNSNPNNRPIHYHMVQKNPFINLFKKYLRVPSPKQTKKDDEDSQYRVGGQIIFINSISSNKEEYCDNSAYLQSIYACAGQQWQGKVYQNYRWDNYFKSQFVEQQLCRIIDSLLIKNYSTLSEFYQAKQFYNEQVKKVKYWIREYKNVINAHFTIKRELKCLQNVNIGFQLQLIGSCIKSDNFKDFYGSKSYISLGRQIVIKTQNIKSQILTCCNQMIKIKNDFASLKKKESSSRNDTIVPQIMKLRISVKQQADKENKNSDNKFKPLLISNTLHVGLNQIQAFSTVKALIFQYLYQIWDKVNISEERTLIQDLIFQQSFFEQLENISKILSDFIQKMYKIQQNQISCHKGDFILSRNNFYQLIKSFNLTKQCFLKSGHTNSKKMLKNNPLTDKKMRKTNFQLPKLGKDYKKLFTQANLNRLQERENLIKRSSQLIEVKGKINFATMMINPNQL